MLRRALTMMRAGHLIRSLESDIQYMQSRLDSLWSLGLTRCVLCLSLAAALLSAACAARPETGFLLPVAEAGANATSHTMLIATTRQRDQRPGTFFNVERAEPIDYAQITVSVPHPPHAVVVDERAYGTQQMSGSLMCAQG